MTKYIFVTGGVVSSLGKGIVRTVIKKSGPEDCNPKIRSLHQC